MIGVGATRGVFDGMKNFYRKAGKMTDLLTQELIDRLGQLPEPRRQDLVRALILVVDAAMDSVPAPDDSSLDAMYSQLAEFARTAPLDADQTRRRDEIFARLRERQSRQAENWARRFDASRRFDAAAHAGDVNVASESW